MKLKTLFFALTLIACFKGQSQRLIDRSGTVTFFSEAPLENIEATNYQALGALDMEASTVAVSILMKGFRFEKALMEEHFNENYVESDQFPKATFKGNLSVDPAQFQKDGTFSALATGEVMLHGITRPLKTQVDFVVSENQLSAKTSFVLKVADFDIKIPTAVIRNIAEEVEVTASFQFKSN